jgi:hypothetical protein
VRAPLGLIIHGREVGPAPIDYLAESLARLAPEDQAEVWLSEEDGPSLCVLKSGGRALLMFLRRAGDPGMTSRSELTESGGTLSFTLSNGQVDEYPVAWTVPFDRARQAAEYFWFHRGPAPFVVWHDDG